MLYRVKLPATFVQDRLDRGLKCGIVKWSGRQAQCSVSRRVLKDIADDAGYQAKWTDSDNKALKRSAALACEIASAQLKSFNR
jgi:hypothetical protein